MPYGPRKSLYNRYVRRATKGPWLTYSVRWAAPRSLGPGADRFLRREGAPLGLGETGGGGRNQAIHRQVEGNGTMPNISSRANRRWKSCFSRVLYRDPSAIERMFCRLTDIRRVATRYDRNAVKFLAAVKFVAMVSYW